MGTFDKNELCLEASAVRRSRVSAAKSINHFAPFLENLLLLPEAMGLGNILATLFGEELAGVPLGRNAFADQGCTINLCRRLQEQDSTA